jgi:hypothetical protein
MVSLLEVPGCFVSPTGGTQSGRLSSVRKKHEQQRRRVFLSLLNFFCINFCAGH